MKCPDALHLLDDYLDEELTAETRSEFEGHLRRCPECRRELESLQSLLDRTHELEAEIRPARDLWPGIETRVRDLTAPDRQWWSQLAAAAVILVILSIPLSVWWAGRQPSETEATIEIGASDRGLAVQANLARSEDGVMLPRTDLAAAIERRRDVVEDRTLVVLEENMRLLDKAIGELHAALEDDPQNLHLRMSLAARYQQERKLLQKAYRV